MLQSQMDLDGNLPRHGAEHASYKISHTPPHTETIIN